MTWIKLVRSQTGYTFILTNLSTISDEVTVKSLSEITVCQVFVYQEGADMTSSSHQKSELPGTFDKHACNVDVRSVPQESLQG